LNEELHTVSAEHQLKIKELIDLNDDLNNYFKNSNIGQILIDKNMVVRKFSPAISRQINLIESDIGRSIGDITNNLRGFDLLSVIKRVIETNENIEQEVETRDGNIFLMRTAPYVKQDKTLDGVVVNFVDITETKKLNGILEGVFESSTNGISAMLAIRDQNQQIADFRFIAINRAAERMMGVRKGDCYQENVFKGLPKSEELYNKYVTVVETGDIGHFEFFYHRNQHARLAPLADHVIADLAELPKVLAIA